MVVQGPPTEAADECGLEKRLRPLTSFQFRARMKRWHSPESLNTALANLCSQQQGKVRGGEDKHNLLTEEEGKDRALSGSFRCMGSKSV